MFEGSLVESNSLLRSRNRWPAVASVGVQLLLAAVFVAIPLMYPEVLPLTSARLALSVPPLPRPVPPPVPKQPVRVQTIVPNTSAVTAPSTQPAQLPHTWTSSGAPVDAPTLAVGLNLGPARPNLPDAILGNGTPGVRVGPSSTSASTRASGKPLPISTGVLVGLLVEPIRPIYPQIAKVTRTEGDVVVQAIISRTGHIESAHVVSGSVMLQQAALDAVRSARYHPYLLNGEPTEVETTITIHFHING
jgi:protein TonB